MRTRSAIRGPVLTSLLCLSIACSPTDVGKETEGAGPTEAVVVLTLSGISPDGFQDAIQGQQPCDTPLNLRNLRCAQDFSKLAEAVLHCGSRRVTIDMSSSHVQEVYFPSRRNSPVMRGSRSDFDIVRCVQQEVGFRFTAGIAASVENRGRADQRPFEALHDVEQQAH